MWWSMSGTRLAFMTTNDTNVPQIQYDYYDSNNVYPEIKSTPYPKAGEPIPKVSLHIWYKLDKTVVNLNPPPQVSSLK
jgi:Dipeptidyl peptidase IV (DPP IV) N-terminal region